MAGTGTGKNTQKCSCRTGKKEKGVNGFSSDSRLIDKQEWERRVEEDDGAICHVLETYGDKGKN